MFQERVAEEYVADRSLAPRTDVELGDNAEVPPEGANIQDTRFALVPGSGNSILQDAP